MSLFCLRCRRAYDLHIGDRGYGRAPPMPRPPSCSEKLANLALMCLCRQPVPCPCVCPWVSEAAVVDPCPGDPVRCAGWVPTGKEGLIRAVPRARLLGQPGQAEFMSIGRAGPWGGPVVRGFIACMARGLLFVARLI